MSIDVSTPIQLCVYIYMCVSVRTYIKLYAPLAVLLAAQRAAELGDQQDPGADAEQEARAARDSFAEHPALDTGCDFCKGEAG